MMTAAPGHRALAHNALHPAQGGGGGEGDGTDDGDDGDDGDDVGGGWVKDDATTDEDDAITDDGAGDAVALKVLECHPNHGKIRPTSPEFP